MADFALNMSSQEVAVTKKDFGCKRIKKRLSFEKTQNEILHLHLTAITTFFFGE